MIGLRAQRYLWPLTVLATWGAALGLQACSGKVQEPSDCAGASCGGGSGAAGGKAEGGSAAVSGLASEGGSGATVATCTNGLKDPDEADVDCGGLSHCERCSNNAKCRANGDCESQFCKSGRCSEPTCTDKLQNQDETGVDCGGAACEPCADAGSCKKASDCQSAVCSKGKCGSATCSDQVKNQDETDVDCGGVCSDTQGCANGERCNTAADCDSYVCSAGKCAADLAIATADVIDDFEDADLLLPSPARAGRVGNWYIFNDGTGTEALNAVAIKRGTSSANGLRVKGKDFSNWGSGFSVDLNSSASGQATKAPYDASAYSAVTFWARASDATGVAVALTDVDTDAAGNTCSSCGRHYYKTVSMTATWQRFTISFSDLTLEAGGVPAPAAFKPASVLSLQFKFQPGINYEISVDDVAFIKK